MLSLDYVAGIVDGEGSIFIFRNIAGSGNRIYRLAVNVCNTNKILPELLKEDFGGNIKEVEYAAPKKNIYQWLLYSIQAMNFLEKVTPHLILKREQAELAMSFQKLRQHETRRKRTLKENIRDSIMMNDMKALNKKGKVQGE